MKKGIIFGFLLVFGLFFASKAAFAAGFGSQFGGRVASPKAIEIESLEAMGYNCLVPGSTISIMPIGSPLSTPVSFFIPAFTRSRTDHSIRASQLIIGRYSFKTTINCIRSNPFSIIPVSLDTILLFGNSR